MGSVFGRCSSCRAGCVKVLWRKRGANAAYCCNLATAAKILGEGYSASVNLGLAIGSTAGTFRCRQTVIGDCGEHHGEAGAHAKPDQAVGKPLLRLPDPRGKGPFRPFTGEPGWSEAWWWLGIPVVVAIFAVLTHRLAPDWHRTWVTSESGILETGQFILMVMGLAIAVLLLFDPFVRQRPLVLALTVIAALACLFIGGEEVSWGQHIFFWQDPSLVSAVNGDGEFSLHNVNKGFERTPRALLEIAVLAGGLAVPAVSASVPRVRQSRVALFLPSAALVPTALLMLVFKFDGSLAKYLGGSSVAARSSEMVEFYLYFFGFAYLAIFDRRIRQLEAEGSLDKAKPVKAKRAKASMAS